MNFFFSVRSDLFDSKLKIPKFQNNNLYCLNYNLYEASISNNLWSIKKTKVFENDNFYFLENNDLNNHKIFFLSEDNEISINYNNDYTKLLKLNNFTDTNPAFRSNLQLSKKNFGFSSYQSEYPYKMILKKGSILSPLNVLTNNKAEMNLLLIRNIFYLPIKEKFKIYFVNLKLKKIIKEYEVKTNTTNIINIDKNDLDTNNYIISDKYIGVPIFLSIHNNHMSFEHTHPPHEYILSDDKFETVKKIKSEIHEIIS